MARMQMEETDVFARYLAVANWAWRLAIAWPEFARDTIGKQLVRAADSIGANLVEGDGRATDPDAVRFFVIARASARETRYWIRCAADRKLVDLVEAKAQVDAITSATRLLNSLISYRRSYAQQRRYGNGVVKEQPASYAADEDPFACDLDMDADVATIMNAYSPLGRVSLLDPSLRAFEPPSFLSPEPLSPEPSSPQP